MAQQGARTLVVQLDAGRLKGCPTAPAFERACLETGYGFLHSHHRDCLKNITADNARKFSVVDSFYWHCCRLYFVAGATSSIKLLLSPQPAYQLLQLLPHLCALLELLPLHDWVCYCFKNITVAIYRFKTFHQVFAHTPLSSHCHCCPHCCFYVDTAVIISTWIPLIRL